MDFYKALEALYSGPAKDFFAVMHSQTEAGESVFHLLAKVQSQQKNFASGTGQMIISVLPLTVNHHTHRVSNNQKQWEERKPNQLLQWFYGTMLASSGAPLSVEFFNEGYYIVGAAMAVVAVEGLRQCYFAYKDHSEK